MKFTTLALGALLFVNPRTTFDAPRWTLIMQNTRTSPWVVVTRATIAQSGTRLIQVNGPWMGKVTSVTGSGGVTARNLQRDGDNTVTMILDGATSAPRGNKNIQLNVRCDVVNLPFGCTNTSVSLPVKVLETGPINHIYPNGTLPANTSISFDLDGEGMDVAVLLPRLLTLKNAVILSKTATTMKVRGTTASCGYMDVALSDVADGDENPYRKGSSLQPVIAGTVCGGSPRAFVVINCQPGTTWNASTKTCDSNE